MSVVLILTSGAVAASKYKVVFDFGKAGYRPVGNLAVDRAGNFYGVCTLGSRSHGGQAVNGTWQNSWEFNLTVTPSSLRFRK